MAQAFVISADTEKGRAILTSLKAMGMAIRFERGAEIRCYADADVVTGSWERRVERIRYRVLLGEYDSDHVIAELARRIMASGQLEDPSWPARACHQRHHVS